MNGRIRTLVGTAIMTLAVMAPTARPALARTDIRHLLTSARHAYQRGDLPAVISALGSALADSPPQPNLTRMTVKGVPAQIRWNPLARSGEVTLVIDRRMLVEIGGDGLANTRLIVGLARSVDIAGLRKLIRA